MSIETAPEPAPTAGAPTDWRAVLAGGATALPRWTAARDHAGERHGSRVVPMPPDLARAVAEVAATHGVAVAAVDLAAHARVVAGLTGEPEAVTTLAGPPGQIAPPTPTAPTAHATGPAPGRPCRLDTGVGSWSALLAAADAAVTACTVGGPDGEVADRAVAALRADPTAGLWPPTELATDATRDPGPRPITDPATAVRVTRTDAELRIDHRTDVLDGAAADRVAGYHLTALRALTSDPTVAPSAVCLPGPEELAFQVDGLAGPPRELPDRRPHDLVRDRAATHPDAAAVVRGEQAWTYRELDEHSDGLARALLARGLGAEDVVAVVAERTLGWAAAVLGILKAGGAYLPLEPHFPAERIATVLTRAGARFVLTEPDAAATLDAALSGLGAAGPVRLVVADAAAEHHPDVDPHVEVGPERLAYLYFTSGSTGEPKGAMCEHAGMHNHLLAKIDDLGIDAGSVVAQTAPQCFDISLWQLLAGWLVGACTVLVEQEAVLDVPRFVDLLVARRVSVAQLVPSYLDVVVSYLETQPMDLPDLRCVAVTGEAVKKELVARWFAVRPDVALVNAYGLTETSDDTNHEVMHGVPDHDRVPLGRAVAGVRVYVVDPALVPVPLGAPGEIVFSGVCVGRGYVNDPERTRAAFVPDPLRPGERLYRSGDHGRWLPDGKLDFLGRRDHQVKISGFRIEIGEVENTLLKAHGVRDSAVVVHERAGRGKQLVGFYSASAPIADDELRALLRASLPEYMVPPVLHHRTTLPATANGKIDRKALGALAAELDGPEGPDAAGEGPRTATERRVAAVWAPLLGLGEDAVARDTHFFERGGSSLLAVKMALRLGKTVDLADIARHPVLADLAALLDDRAAAATGPATATATAQETTMTPSSASTASAASAGPTALDAPTVDVPVVPAPAASPGPAFAVIPGTQVADALHGREREIVDVVAAAYRMHGAGQTSNPPSYFLRFADKPNSRIIALPASVGGDVGVDGIKWVSSFPDNVAAGLPRASAVLILNDHATGYPFACLEASIINAVRTSASAALAADRLTAGRPRPTRVGFFGVGLIARYLHTYLAATGWAFDEVGVYDLSPESAEGFRGYLHRHDPDTTVTVHDDAEALVRSADLLVFATVAGEPHVHDPDWFAHHPLVLHVSLRDLAPEVVLDATNVVDDVDHCLRAGTSLHLAEQQVGHRDFVLGTLDDVMTGRIAPPPDRTTIFSPFGLGILDLAVGKAVYDQVARNGALGVVDGFFHELQRYGRDAVAPGPHQEVTSRG